MVILYREKMDSPLGELWLLTDGDGALRVMEFASHEDRLIRLADRQYGRGKWAIEEAGVESKAKRALRAYFAGDTSALNALPVATGGTEFQRSVWAALRAIPCGETISYGELARRIGNPKAVRAVGLANGANPIGIVVPCHRVISSDGGLGGYGGGVERKAWLLKHEGAIAA
jgi:methylated-DNA-[protein]-cysteine S-methyltransferase